MRDFGLIGKKLGHSFSKKYFETKFAKESIIDCTYSLFELSEITEVPNLIAANPNLKGFNITIPYKQEILPYLNQLDTSAEKVGAVNVVSMINGQLVGYNSDYYGFKKSLESWLTARVSKALILGTGGASKAVLAALNDMSIDTTSVSRSESPDNLTYQALIENSEFFQSFDLIINTTPLGMSPDVDSCPQLPYAAILPHQYFYDLVYNPLETTMMRLAAAKGAKTKNGLEMLQLQAEKSWEIWNSQV
jgi:shikimate dehydrogenase